MKRPWRSRLLVLLRLDPVPLVSRRNVSTSITQNTSVGNRFTSSCSPTYNPLKNPCQTGENKDSERQQKCSGEERQNDPNATGQRICS